MGGGVSTAKTSLSLLSVQLKLAVVEPDNCMGCGLCQVVCPTDAILMQEARPEEFVPGN